MGYNRPAKRLPAPATPAGLLRNRFFPWTTAREARKLNKHCRIVVFFDRGQENKPGSIRFSEFEEACKARGLTVTSEPPRIDPLSSITFIYLQATEHLSDTAVIAAGARYESFDGVIAIVRESECQAAAFSSAKVEIPPSGLPLSQADLYYLFRAIPHLETHYNRYKTKFESNTIPLALTTRNHLGLLTHRAANVPPRPIPPPSDVSMPTLIRTEVASDVSMDTAMPELDARGERHLRRIAREELRRREREAMDMENGAVPCRECKGKGRVFKPAVQAEATAAVARKATRARRAQSV